MRPLFDMNVRAACFSFERAVLLFFLMLALFACQPKIIVKEQAPLPPAAGENADLIFERAEAKFQAQKYPSAFQDYAAYLTKVASGEKSRQALFRMAKIKSALAEYQEALVYLTRLLSEYAEHPESPLVLCDVMEIYYRTANYNATATAGQDWVRLYPDHPARAEVSFLTGKAYLAMGEEIKAFQWWLKSSDLISKGRGDLSRRQEVEESIIGMIQAANLETLQGLEKIGSESQYAPHLFHQLAKAYLAADKSEDARIAAMNLIRSSNEQNWIAAGRQILEMTAEKPVIERGRIGCLLPLSGSFAVYGQAVLNGIQLALREEQHDENAPKIELVVRDSGNESDLTVQELEEMARKEKVLAVIGPLASKFSTAAARKAQELGVPIITLTQKEGITREGDMVFQNFLTPFKEIKALLDKVIQEKNITRFGILYPDNAYGRSMMNLFWTRAEAMGATITAVESYAPDETDFSAEIKKMVGLYYPRPESVKQLVKTMKAKLPKSLKKTDKKKTGKGQTEEEDPFIDFDAVFVPDNYNKVALIAPQFPFHNVFSLPLLGTSLWQSDELIELAGDYVQGAIFPSGFFLSSESSQIRDFIKRYEENFQAKPGLLSATGYDTMRYIQALLKEMPVESRKDFQKALLVYDGYYGLTGRIAFDQQRETTNRPMILTVKGKFINVIP